MNGTFTETCMYTGASVGVCVALYFDMEWWGLGVVFGAAFIGAVFGAGIKAAWFMRQSQKARIANEAVKRGRDENPRLPGE